MKNFKKISAFILSIMMLFSFMPVGAFTIADDVNNTAYEESAYVLGALGIMVGDAGTGNFRPEDSITRAEFARVAVSLLGLDDIAESAKGESKYPDVSLDHWANGYINTATAQNLVIGRDDGNFAPEESITYQDAITILVRAMGYEPSANSKGGYPAGFLAVATQTGLTKNAASAATLAVKRGIVANLTNNALTINMMEQTGFGSNVNYEIVDKTILEDVLDVEYGEGQIVANGFSTLVGASSLKEDEVKINDIIFNVGDSNAENLLGYYVDYYAIDDENGSDNTLLLVRPEKTKTEEITIDGENIEKVTKDEVEYWINKEKDTKTEQIELSSDLKYIYNGVGISADISKIPVKTNGTVKFLDTNKDGKFDIVYIDIIKNLVVEEVIESSYKVIDKYGNETLTLDPEDSGYHFVLVNEDNATVEIKDLKEWDILSYTISENKKLIRVFLSRATVEGKITEISDNKYTINGTEYVVADNFEETLKLEDEGIFYLDAYGRIAAVNKSHSLSKNYGYLINAGVNGSVDTNVLFKILGKDGKVETLNAEEKIRFNDKAGILATDAYKTLLDGEKVKSQLITYKVNSDGKITEIDLAKDLSGGTLTVDKYDFVKNFEGDDVLYTSSSSKLGKFNITDETIVFDIPASSTDYTKYSVTDKSMFENESLYNVSVFDVAEDLTAGVVIVTNSDGKTNAESPIGVVSKITTTRNEDGEQVEKLYLAYKGEIVSYETDGLGVLVKGKDNKKLEAGDVIQFKLDSKGRIEKFDLLFDINEKATEFEKDVTDKMTLVYGKVTKKFANSINVSVNGGAVENYSLNNVDVYLYNSQKSANKISVATTGDIQRYDSEDESRVLLRIYNGEVKEVVIVK